MRAVIYKFMIFIFVIFLLITPQVSAQNDEENQEDDEGCIFATFCLIMLFIIFLIYFSAKRKSERSREGRPRGGMYPPTSQPGRWYPRPYTAYPPPPPTTYPRKPEPRREDVKCDLCGSRNLRFFEEGYVKCNECRHVFYITEGYRPKKRR